MNQKRNIASPAPVVSAVFAYDIANAFRDEWHAAQSKVEYWKERCEAAEAVLVDPKIDSGMSDEQKMAYWKWRAIVDKSKQKIKL